MVLSVDKGTIQLSIIRNIMLSNKTYYQINVKRIITILSNKNALNQKMHVVKCFLLLYGMRLFTFLI